MIGKHSSGDLQQFVSSNFASKNAAVIGVGVPHEQLVEYAQKLSLLSSSSGSSAASKVHSGDVRMDVGGSTAYVALATAGASLSDLKSTLVFALLQRVLGSGKLDGKQFAHQRLNVTILCFHLFSRFSEVRNFFCIQASCR